MGTLCSTALIYFAFIYLIFYIFDIILSLFFVDKRTCEICLTKKTIKAFMLVYITVRN